MSETPRKMAKKKKSKAGRKRKVQTRAGKKGSTKKTSEKGAAKDNKRSHTMSANENSENPSAQKAVPSVGGTPSGEEVVGTGNPARKKSSKVRVKDKIQTRAGGKVSAKENKRSSSMSVNENSESQSAQQAVASIGGALGGEETAGAGNLARVRDILFGAQIRDYDKRFTRVEERLIKEIGELQQDNKKRLESLELYLKEEVESLVDRLKGEQQEREKGLQEMGKELKEMASAFEKRVGQLNEQLDKGERSLRQHILDQANNLRDEMKQNQGELREALDKEAQELRDVKVDRAALGDLFMEVSMRLNDQFQLPETE
jgi:hypothetical protein